MSVVSKKRIFSRKGVLFGILTGILVLSSLIRLSYIQLHNVPVGDEVQYLTVSKRVYEGKTYRFESLEAENPTEFKAANGILPFYVGSVVLAHHLTGYRVKNAQYVNLGFSLLVTLTVFLLTLAMFRSKTAAVLASLLAAFDPVLTKMTLLATKDISFCFAALLIILVVSRYRHRIWWYVLCSLSLALLILSRRNGYFFIPPLLLWFIMYVPEKRWRRLINFSGVLLMAGFLVSPWYMMEKGPEGNEFAFIGQVIQGKIFISAKTQAAPVEGAEVNGDRSHSPSFAKTYRANLQNALRTVAGMSGILHAVLLFSILGIAALPRRNLDVFIGASFLVFLSVFSIATFDDASLDFYYLPFFPVLLIYSSAGMMAVVSRIIRSPASGKAILILMMAVVFLPLSEDIRNHVHPALKGKNSDIGRYREMETVVAWLNTHLLPEDRIAGNSTLRHFLFDLNNRMIELPRKEAEFGEEYLRKYSLDYMVVGVKNLLPVEPSTSRLYLKKYWGQEDSVLVEKAVPPYLKQVFRTESQCVYRVLPPFPDSSVSF